MFRRALHDLPPEMFAEDRIGTILGAGLLPPRRGVRRRARVDERRSTKRDAHPEEIYAGLPQSLALPCHPKAEDAGTSARVSAGWIERRRECDLSSLRLLDSIRDPLWQAVPYSPATSGRAPRAQWFPLVFRRNR